jgi:hypothetical protein
VLIWNAVDLGRKLVIWRTTERLHRERYEVTQGDGSSIPDLTHDGE